MSVQGMWGHALVAQSVPDIPGRAQARRHAPHPTNKLIYRPGQEGGGIVLMFKQSQDSGTAVATGPSASCPIHSAESPQSSAQQGTGSTFRCSLIHPRDGDRSICAASASTSCLSHRQRSPKSAQRAKVGGRDPVLGTPLQLSIMVLAMEKCPSRLAMTRVTLELCTRLGKRSPAAQPFVASPRYVEPCCLYQMLLDILSL